jgi:hypothetical protein
MSDSERPDYCHHQWPTGVTSAAEDKKTPAMATAIRKMGHELRWRGTELTDAASSTTPAFVDTLLTWPRRLASLQNQNASILWATIVDYLMSYHLIYVENIQYLT